MPRIAVLHRALNLETLDYCFEASIMHSIKVFDEVCIVAASMSTDNTIERLHALQDRFPDQVKVQVREFPVDQNWAELTLGWAREMTDCEWICFLDLDEAIHEDDAEAFRNLTLSGKKLITFPIRHYYGTPNWQVVGGHFYQRHARLGHISTGFRIRNNRVGKQGCIADPVVDSNGKVVVAHELCTSDVLNAEVPIHHYGWCRATQSKAQHTKVSNGFYYNKEEVRSGNVPVVENARIYDMKKVQPSLRQVTWSHPCYVRELWFPESPHPEEWAMLNAQLDP